MIGGDKVLGVIPARGGSKGVARKNVRDVAGRPLLAWTIEAARRSCLLDHTILSSDDDEIMEVARQFDCDVPFRRPAVFATDEAQSIDVALHALDFFPTYNWLVLLQPTSPLRRAEHIDGVLSLAHERHAPAAVSICPAPDHPAWMFYLNDDRLEPATGRPPPARRQNLPQAFLLNGAVYAARADWLRESRSFVGPGAVGFVMDGIDSLDIDTESDLIDADRRLRSGYNSTK